MQHVGANANGAAAASVKLSSVAKGKKAPREHEATPPASEESESGSARGGDDDDDIVGVCTALVKMLSADGIGLTELDLAHNAISDAAGAVLERGLRDNKTLERLDLSENKAIAPGKLKVHNAKCNDAVTWSNTWSNMCVQRACLKARF